MKLKQKIWIQVAGRFPCWVSIGDKKPRGWVAPPKTNSLPLKITLLGRWDFHTVYVYGMACFQGQSVSFRECRIGVKETWSPLNKWSRIQMMMILPIRFPSCTTVWKKHPVDTWFIFEISGKVSPTHHFWGAKYQGFQEKWLKDESCCFTYFPRFAKCTY